MWLETYKYNSKTDDSELHAGNKKCVSFVDDYFVIDFMYRIHLLIL